MIGEEEVFFQCPYCWQSISMVVESNYSNQQYIEDCEVCCNPIEISYIIEDSHLISIEAKRLND